MDAEQGFGVGPGRDGRKPRLADVERTGIAWLVSKYKQYNVLRERILGDTSRLRDRG